MQFVMKSDRSVKKLACFALLAASAQACGQACGTWEAFGIPDLEPGLDLPVRSFATFDDGGGPALYAGGGFSVQTAQGTVRAGIVRWGHSGWEPIGPSNLSGVTLAVHDDGAGARLYGGGSQGVHRIEGMTSVQLGPTFNPIALAVHDEGGAAALYAGGIFTSIGGVPIARLAKWNGQNWEEVGGGISGGSNRINALRSHDDGSGRALYVAGNFETAGTVPAASIARWRNSAWEAVVGGAAMGGSPLPNLSTLGEDPQGRLVVGGNFDIGVASQNIAVWDGVGWTALGEGLPERVTSLHAFAGELHAGTAVNFAIESLGRIARWDGAAWHTVALLGHHGDARLLSPESEVAALASLDTGQGEELYIGGAFGYLNDQPINHIARMRAGSFEAHPGRAATIRDMEVLDSGDGPALYIFGKFHKVHGQVVNNIARWRGNGWEPVGDPGNQGVTGTVYSMTAGQLAGASQRTLVAAGIFHKAGGEPVMNIAQWTPGAGWSALGDGLALGGSMVNPRGITGLEFHDDGGGMDLYASGRFGFTLTPGPRHIARWDGSAWTEVGNANSFTTMVITDIESFDGDLYIGLSLSSLPTVPPAQNIARWNGSVWAGLGANPNAPVSDLLVHDLGSGPMLYARGSFQTVGGITSRGIAAWDGAAWHSVEGLQSQFSARGLAAKPAPSPAVTVIGHSGTVLPGGYSFGLWDGTQWTGIEGETTVDPISNIVKGAWFDDGGGEALYVGRDLHAINGMPTWPLARWKPCTPCYANCDESTVPPILNVDDFTCFINEFASAQALPHEQQIEAYANCDGSTIAPALNVDDFTCFIDAFAQGCP